jgi:hypothetical protein
MVVVSGIFSDEKCPFADDMCPLFFFHGHMVVAGGIFFMKKCPW